MPVYESWFAIAAGERLVGIFITEHKWASDMHEDSKWTDQPAVVWDQHHLHVDR
jgi:hypothetical protein